MVEVDTVIPRPVVSGGAVPAAAHHRRLVLVSEVNALRRTWMDLERVRRGVEGGQVPLPPALAAECESILAVVLIGIAEVAAKVSQEV